MKHLLALTLVASLAAAAPQEKNPGDQDKKPPGEQDKKPPTVQEKPKPFIRSFQDASGRNMRSELEILVKEHEVMPVPSKEAVTAAQALKRLRKVVDKQSDAEAKAGLAKAELAKTADGLQAMAAAAALSDNKMGALAALLAAVEKFPADVDARANLAGMAATLGFAAEALALLDKIDEKAVSKTGMGVPGRSFVLAIRGHALVSQHRYSDAKEALKQALAAAPQLSEAGLNLAIALDKLGEKEESKRAFFAAAWRGSPNQLVCGGGEAKLTGDPFKDSFQDDVTSRLPASKILDLSKGVVGTFPPIYHPSNVADMETWGKWAEAQLKKVQEQLQADQKEFISLGEKLGARKQTLSEKRARDIQSLIGIAHEEPELHRIWLAYENRQDLGKATAKILEAGAAEYLEILKAKLEAEETERRCKALSNRLIPQVKPHAKRIEQLMRDWWAAAHKHKTGIAANLKDKDWHDLAMTEIRMEGAGIYSVMITEIGGWYLAGLYAKEDGKKPDGPEDLQKPNVPACSGNARNTEVEFKIAEALSISASCEKVGIELSVDVFPGLGGYTKLEIEPGGVSVHVGPKAELGIPGAPNSATVKDGLYLEVGSEGIKDVGFEVSFEAGQNVTPGAKVSQTIDSMKFSFMPTPAR